MMRRFEFDNAVSTKTDRTALDSRYDSGDGLHLNTAGYAALAKAIPGRI
jgi:lysophospholipase L1-like esterase